MVTYAHKTTGAYAHSIQLWLNITKGCQPYLWFGQFQAFLVVPFSIDAVLKSSLIAPRQYIGKLYFNGMEYAAHQNTQRVSKLYLILDRFTERLNDVTYAIFLRSGMYGISDRVIIEDVLYDDENDTYMIWLYYHEAGAAKAEEYFGPASSAEEAEKIRDVFCSYYFEGK